MSIDISLEGETEPYPCEVNLPVDDAVKDIQKAYDLRAGRIDKQDINGQWVAMRSGNIIVGGTYRFKGSKPASQQTAVPTQLKTFGDGIPALVPALSPSKPSIPPSSRHGKVEVEVKDFGLLSEDTFFPLRQRYTRLWWTSNAGVLSYFSKNDIAGFVKIVIEDVINALGLSCKVVSETATFELRPDLWFITDANKIPIGIVEVKKPDLNDKSEVLAAPTVLGEVYDFAMLLPNFYGARPVFALVTNLRKWRVCWLNSEGCNEVAAKEEVHSFASSMASVATPEKSSKANSEESNSFYASPSKKNHPMPEEVANSYAEEVDEEKASEDSECRFMFVSPIYDSAECGGRIFSVIASALLKMNRARCQPFLTPFERLEQRTIMRFVKGSSQKIFWDRLRGVKGKWNTYARSTKYLYAIEDLGRGADGKVWLTCTSGGAVCVLKFPNVQVSPKQPTLDGMDLVSPLQFEKFVWDQIYPEFSSMVLLEVWAGREALKMPHIPAIPIDERRDCMGKVEKALSLFDGNGLVHCDVAWRNMGMWVDREGESRVIVFDLQSVCRKADGDEDWINKAIRDLLL